MSSIVEVSESGTLQLPAELLQAIGHNTRFVVKVESDRIFPTMLLKVLFRLSFRLRRRSVCAKVFFTPVAKPHPQLLRNLVFLFFSQRIVKR